MKKTILSISCLFLFIALYANSGRITITERSDYSVYVNGAYSGLTYREAHIYLDEKRPAQNISPVYEYNGEAFVLEETRKNMIGTAKKLENIRTIAFMQTVQPQPSRNRLTSLRFTTDEGYPLLRNFPLSPEKTFTDQDIGKKWTGESIVVVAPIVGKEATRIPILAEYQYLGKQPYNGKKTHHIKAQFGVRYKGSDPLGDRDMLRSEGSRIVDIYIDENHRPLFIREKIDESFFYKTAGTIRHKGFLLHFYGYQRGAVYSGGSVPVEALYETKKQEPVQSVTNKERLKDTKSGTFDVRETARGMLLNLNNLHFVADKAQLLNGEYTKLDEIANLLKTLTFTHLFVEGHTADIGNYDGQRELSLLRAKAVVDELVKRGIAAGVFIYNGAGGTKPVAPNDNEEDRAKNRRVEITIME